MGYAETHGIDFTSYFGRSDRVLWADFIEKHRPEQTLEYLAEWKQRRFLEMIRKEEPIFEDLPQLVQRLAARFKLGLASGSYHPVIEAILSMKGLSQFFPVVVSAQSALPEVIGDAGLAAPGEGAAFAAAIRTLLDRPVSARRAAARAQAERFPWSAAVAGFLSAHDAPAVLVRKWQ